MKKETVGFFKRKKKFFCPCWSSLFRELSIASISYFFFHLAGEITALLYGTELAKVTRQTTSNLIFYIY